MLLFHNIASITLLYSQKTFDFSSLKITANLAYIIIKSSKCFVIIKIIMCIIIEAIFS